MKKLADGLIEWAEKEMKSRPDDLEKLKKEIAEAEHKKRYAEATRRLEIINAKRMKKKLLGGGSGP